MKRITTLVLFVLPALLLHSQPRDSVTLMFSPQNIYFHNLRVDIDYRIGRKNILCLSPSFDSYEYTTKYKHFRGGGLAVYDKIFVSEKIPFYLSFGLDYHFCQVAGYNNLNKNYHTSAGQFLVGFKPELRRHLYIDFYTGIGYRVANRDDLESNFNYTDAVEDAYINVTKPFSTGFVFYGGMLIGIGFQP